jgi:hypothetical protein
VSFDEQERQSSDEAELVGGEQPTPGYVEVSTPDGQIIRVSISQEDASSALHMASDNSKFGGGDKHHNKKTFSQATSVSKVIEGGPYGIYQDAGYHHQNSKGVKSMSPINGQKALDNSILIKETSPHRVSIEDDNFVMLRQTSPGEFHGNIQGWEELSHDAQNALKRLGICTNRGKILKK